MHHRLLKVFACAAIVAWTFACQGAKPQAGPAAHPTAPQAPHAASPPPPMTAPGPAPHGDDPFAGKLFPPELIMSHQGELGIDESQKKSILAEIERTQQRMPSLQWQLKAAGEEMGKLVSAAKVDEASVLAQADKIMTIEREVKKLHLTLLIRIKNQLSEAQQAKLFEIRKRGG